MDLNLGGSIHGYEEIIPSFQQFLHLRLDFLHYFLMSDWQEKIVLASKVGYVGLKPFF